MRRAIPPRAILPLATLAALAFLAALAGGCGHNKFQQEAEAEKLAVSLAREAERGGYELVTAEELKGLLDRKPDMVLVDTMPFEESYRAAHVPGARHFLFPIPEMTAWSAQETGGKTQDDFAALLGPDKGKLLVFYCGFVKCTRSHNAALWAVKMGYTNVKRFPGGIYAWKGAGYATEAGG
ncbi:MAG: rhodanese-like domain-containing protein [Planctomycetes bacterium]|nr:rhodanese-like domain-containing protein [Planctomycetota bacterium]